MSPHDPIDHRHGDKLVNYEAIRDSFQLALANRNELSESAVQTILATVDDALGNHSEDLILRRDISGIDPFLTALRTSGIPLKEIPNLQADHENSVIRVIDYVHKQPSLWGFVPEDPDSVDVEAVAEEELYEPYRTAFEGVPEITLTENDEGDDYSAIITIELHNAEPTRQRDLARILSNGLHSRFTKSIPA